MTVKSLQCVELVALAAWTSGDAVPTSTLVSQCQCSRAHVKEHWATSHQGRARPSVKKLNECSSLYYILLD
jgi:hypothetical protein